MSDMQKDRQHKRDAMASLNSPDISEQWLAIEAAQITVDAAEVALKAAKDTLEAAESALEEEHEKAWELVEEDLDTYTERLAKHYGVEVGMTLTVPTSGSKLPEPFQVKESYMHPSDISSLHLSGDTFRKDGKPRAARSSFVLTEPITPPQKASW